MSRTSSPSSPVKPSVLPPLQNGDHLTRDEFERRFDATAGLKKAELIEGRVYMPPPVSHDEHGSPHAKMITWLGLYRIATPGVDFGDNSSLRLDIENMPQPDAYMIIDAEHGGQARVDDDGYIVGAPELIGEIAASSVSYDLYEKLEVYRRNGVREYIVWRTQDRELDYFVLRDGKYERLAADGNQIFRSVVFPGLWLDATALIADDLAKVAKIAQQGAISPEHQAFVEQLRSRRQ